MGIDIYAKWAGQSEQEKEAQITGFSTVHGHVGYLREAYHGEPYATRVLVPEAFDAPECEAAISAATLRERLPETLNAVGGSPASALQEHTSADRFRSGDPMRDS